MTPSEPTTETTAKPRRTARRSSNASAGTKRTSAADRSGRDSVTEQDTRVRAHYLSLERQGQPADPLADWLQAERDGTRGDGEVGSER